MGNISSDDNNQFIHNNLPKKKIDNSYNIQNNNKCNIEHGYKLNHKPNSFKKFEENLKKQIDNNSQEITNNKMNTDKITNNKITNNKLTNNKIINNKIINNFIDDEENLANPYHNIINNNYLNNDNFKNDNEENINFSKPDILIENETDEFEIFKMKILSDKTIDEDMKQILIESRKEQLYKFKSKTKNNIENALRSGIISILIVRLKNDNLVNIDVETKKFLINQIDKWIDGKIKVIKLESETMFELYELINLIKITRPDIDDVGIKKIFEPKNLDDYICYVDTMEKIKLYSIKEEQEKINKQIEKAKLEEEKNIEIGERQKLLKVLIHNLNKLSLIDVETTNLKKDLEIYLNKFISLETNYIELNNGLYEKICNFINSIRISGENKKMLLNSIKIV